MFRRRPASPPPPGRHPNFPFSFGSAAARLRQACLLALLLPVSLFGVLTWQTSRSTERALQERLERLTGLVRENALRVLETHQVLLQQTLELVGGMGDVAIRSQSSPLRARLAHLARDSDSAAALNVFDAEGRLLVSSGLQAPSDATRRAGLEAAGPRVALTPGPGDDWLIRMSARRVDAKGRYLGVAAATLPAAYFDAFLRGLPDLPPGHAVTLLHDDGSVVARRPRLNTRLQLEAESGLLEFLRCAGESGSLRGVSPLDGADRRMSFRKVQGFPLYVLVSHDQLAWRAEWWRQLSASGWQALLVPLLLSSALLWTLWALRRGLAQRQGEAAAPPDELAFGALARSLHELMVKVATDVHVLHVQLRSQPAAGRPLARLVDVVNQGGHLAQQLRSLSAEGQGPACRIDTRQMLTELLPRLAPLLAGQARLDVYIDPHVRPVRADPQALEAALRNLVLNAGEAMDTPGRVVITVCNVQPGDRRLAGRGGEWIEVAVRDTGRGVPAEHLARVFDPFWTTRPGPATAGLGLAQVQRFCTAAGGLALMESQPGRGSTVCLLLPADEGEWPAEVAGQAEPPAA
ncbi:ATP-binding protein [Aquabacterium sp. A7-Y]|uniref:ATP-binding protein n=1 Tax=Aquabacterium sp. A7-Y TaxID=1349605 RepID=UPI00223DCC8D|nr:ATP-binding protein [Aquabacterium sp. A7-Y]MCW7541723.1 ATP-binding protein [Aquabacterium sp. A7-Y]